MAENLYGRNVARECLRSRRRHIHRVLIAQNIERSAIIDEIQRLAGQLKIPVQIVPRQQLDKISFGHQGVALEVGRYPTVTVEDILAQAEKLNEPPFVVAFDHLEDPHNLGAILRTAEAVGVHGVILPQRRSAGITPSVVSASAGATEHIWLAEVSNLVQSLKKLKEAGIWLAGIEKTAQAQPYHQTNLTGPIALVIGSEGHGLSRLAKETCDFLVKLPMRGRIESLNASVACGLILYEVWRARAFHGSD
jgi:23S rRNA (guanosine2251-2'-O)-methyltransferase